jgi:hypothetical protein
MKLTGILLVPFLLSPAASFSQTGETVQAATVRGMLEDTTGKGAKPVPAPGLVVTVENQNYTSPAVKTGKDGLYYIPNVAPGSYILKVWTNPKSPLTFPVTIKGSLTDIPPVVVPPASTVKAGSPAGNVKPKTAAKSK